MTAGRVGPPRTGADDRWRITRHADVAAALRHPALSVGPRALDRRGVDAGPLVELRRRQLINLDGPPHHQLRRMVERAFTPRAVRSMRTSIEHRSAELANGLADSSTFDLVDRYAFKLPVTVICDMLGLDDDVDAIRALSSALVRSFDPDLDDVGLESASAAATAFSELLAQAVDERRDRPRSDLLSEIVRSAADDGVEDRAVVANAVLLVTAGFETTMSLIANAVWLLATHRDVLETVLRDRSLVPGLVEETLRIESPISSVARFASEHLTIGGTEIPAGHDVVLDLAAANRDPEVFPDPERLLVSRSPNLHLAFGGGHHFCLGAALARLEACCAVESLLGLLPDLRLVDEQVEWKPHPTVHCPARLMCSIDRR